MSEYNLPELQKTIPSLLPMTLQKQNLIKTISAEKISTPNIQQKTISVFLSPAKGIPSKGTHGKKDVGEVVEKCSALGKESVAERREKMLARIRERRDFERGEGAVDRELLGAYERGEWCISGLFMYTPPPRYPLSLCVSHPHSIFLALSLTHTLAPSFTHASSLSINAPVPFLPFPYLRPSFPHTNHPPSLSPSQTLLLHFSFPPRLSIASPHR